MFALLLYEKTNKRNASTEGCLADSIECSYLLSKIPGFLKRDEQYKY